MATTMHFLVQVGMWYFFSIMFNIEVKRIFLEYPIPWTVSLISFAVACAGCSAIMGRGQHEPSSTSEDHRASELPYKKLIVIGVLQFLGNFATNLSIQAMSVSFTHVVKATEIIFVLLWSYGLVHYKVIQRATTVTVAQVLVILVITVGVILASLKEATFSWHGLIYGMLANIGFSGRNTLAKWVMSNHAITKEYLFVVASGVSCALCIIPVLVYELPVLATIPKSIYLSLFYTSTMYFLYNTVSFTVLEGVSPVTHAIANCCKRLFIVVVSLIVFRTVIQPQSLVGSLIAIFGVALYSQLTPNQTLFATVGKNLRFILLGSLLVVGALLVPQNTTLSPFAESSSSANECPLPPVFPKMGNSEMIKRLQAETIRLLRPHFAGYKKAVMLDVPDHNNKGDSAIYTGEDHFLKLLNIKLLHSCSDSHAAKRFICNTSFISEIADPKDTIITLHGGGNFGDLWTGVANSRNTYVSELLATGKNYKFLMFPQTVTFRKEEGIKKFQELYGRIENMVFTVRDVPSKEFMEKYFPTLTVINMPDMAWINGHKERARKAPYQILFFLRTDHEGEAKLGDRVRSKMAKIAPGVTYTINDWTSSDVYRDDKSVLEALNYDRFYSGLDFLTQGQVVVTNRLHGHILSTLLDLPHVILDSIYGKVFNNHKAWTLNATDVEMATSIEEAIDKILVMLENVE